MPVPRLLILTASAGGGHLSLAQALRDSLAPHAAVTLADPIPPATAAQYRWMSRHARWLYAAGYALSDSPAAAGALHLLFEWRLAGALRRLLPGYDGVISTYPFLTREVARALARMRLRTPLLMLFADPERVHHAWLTERAAVALAPTRETHAQALAAGFSRERLHLAGWPVRAGFHGGQPARAATLGRLGLDPDRFTVLLQGGGEGSAGFVGCLVALRAAGVPQVIVATGTNQRLARELAGLPGVRAVPHTPAIAPLVAAADLVAGKAGPNALMETVALGRPFLATSYIPGQEHGNLTFIRRHGLGWAALSARAQRAAAERLLAEPAMLAEAAAAARRYAAWNRAACAAIPALVRRSLADPPSD